ncbi:MAG: four helix bundle protein [Bacteroidales bacterium]|nr:four helix bundle protein [Bacteroidales bacterium]MBN2763168.1 four helix bundle protein [Bacteroidales bacterium]
METHKSLIVWQKSISFVITIYNLTKSFPRNEMYGIVSQIRRAAVSIPSNIAEGCARRNTREYIQFLYVSLGSAAEIETHLIISSNLNFIIKGETERLHNELEEILRMLTGLIKSLSNRE